MGARFSIPINAKGLGRWRKLRMVFPSFCLSSSEAIILPMSPPQVNSSPMCIVLSTKGSHVLSIRVVRVERGASAILSRQSDRLMNIPFSKGRFLKPPPSSKGVLGYWITTNSRVYRQCSAYRGASTIHLYPP